MAIRPRTLRRLGAFLLVAAIVAAMALLFHQQSQRRETARLLEQRRLGLQALALGDYAVALSGLGAYLSDVAPPQAESDFDARLGYARARAGLYEPGERHLEQSGRVLRDLADDFPDGNRHLEALKLLMEVTALGHNWQELRRHCDEALSRHPLDVISLRMRREALEQLGDYEAALADAQTLVGVSPTDVDEQVRLLRLLAQLGHTPERIVTRAISLAASDASDPRFLLVLAVAYRNAGQSQQALTCLRQAADFELPEDDPVGFAMRLVGLLDMLGEPDEARDVYVRAVLDLPSAEPARDQLRQLLALRLWQMGELDNALGVLTTNDIATSVDVVATRTLLLFEKGESAQARQSLAVLARLTESVIQPEVRRRGIAWHEGLSAAYSVDNRTTRQRLDALLSSQARILELRPYDIVLATDRPTGLLIKWTGDCYAELGELENAMMCWRQAAEMLPAWPEPLVRVANAAIELGMPKEAQTAVADAAGLLELAAEERLQALRARTAYKQWLTRPTILGGLRTASLSSAQQRDHALYPETLPAHVHMTALVDPAEARRVIRQRLALGASAALRIELADVSARTGLDVQDELLAGVNDPAVAVVRARALADAGDTSGAMALFAALPNDGQATNVSWKIARARLLSHIGAPEAAAAWRDLAAVHSADLDVQTAVLNQRALLEHDRELADKTIERISELTGPTARHWRLERARWLLGSATREAALDAAQLLRALIRQAGAGADTIEARMLLAQALLQVGSPALAREHLETACALDPARADIGLRLVRLYRDSGEWENGQDLLLRLAAAGCGPVRDRIEVARQLAALGNEGPAISLLKQAHETGQADEEAGILLARCLHRSGRVREAEAAFLTISGDKASAAALLAAAQFFTLTGSRNRADALLTRLEQRQPSDVERHLTRAAYLSRAGDHQRARDALSLALARMPEAPEAWVEAALFELQCGDPAAALDVLARAKDTSVHDPSLATLALQAKALADAPADDCAQLEIMASMIGQLDDPSTWHEVGTALLAAAANLREHRVPSRDDLVSLENAAQVLKHFRPLHEVLAGFYEVLDLPAERLRVACGIAEALPHDPLAQRLAFEASRDANNIPRARYFANRWEQSAGANTLLAAAAKAEAHLLSGNYAAANEVIAPHHALLADAGADAARLLMLSSEIQAARGDYARAWENFSPHLASSASWRSAAIRSAAMYITDVRQGAEWLEAIEQMLDSLERDFTGDRAPERTTIAEAWVSLGGRLQERACLERGVGQLQRLTAGSMSQDVDAWEALAEAALASGNEDLAKTALRRVLALNPRRPRAANQLAKFLIATPDAAAQREALTWASMAVEQSPGNADFHATLGRAYLAEHAPESASSAFENALNLDERHIDSLLGLGRALVLLDEEDTAARLYDLLLPSYRDSVPRDQDLREDFELLDDIFGRDH